MQRQVCNPQPGTVGVPEALMDVPLVSLNERGGSSFNTRSSKLRKLTPRDENLFYTAKHDLTVSGSQPWPRLGFSIPLPFEPLSPPLGRLSNVDVTTNFRQQATKALLSSFMAPSKHTRCVPTAFLGVTFRANKRCCRFIYRASIGCDGNL